MGATHATDRRKVVIAVLVAAVLLALSALLPFPEWAEHFEDSLNDHTLLVAIALFTAVYTVATMLFAPGWIFPLVAGAAFGITWGLIIALGASIASATAATSCAMRSSGARIGIASSSSSIARWRRTDGRSWR